MKESGTGFVIGGVLKNLGGLTAKLGVALLASKTGVTFPDSLTGKS